MKKVIARLEELKEYYERISEQATEALKELQVEGNIRIQNCRGADEFFLCTIKGDTKGKYLKKHERGIIKHIIQRDYNRKVLKCANDWMEWIDSTLKKIPAETLPRIYEKSHRRKPWIVPYELPDDEYRKQWEQVEYIGKEFKEGTPEIYTEKGIRVRSKTEKMIADKLDLLEIPYRYEYPINIDERRVLYPDFIILDVKTRREYIWEHFGMMDNPEYAELAVRKIQNYARNGFYAGVNIIYTFETSRTPVDFVGINKLLKYYMLI